MFWIKLFMVAAWVSAAIPGDVVRQAQNAVPARQERVREFKLTDGNILKGDLASATAEGFLVKLDVGGFSERIPWTKLTQETIRKLENHPEAGRWVRPFIEIPPEVKAQARANRPPRRSNYSVKPVPNKAELAPEKSDFFATVTMPFYVVIIGLLFAGNVYAGYEVAVFRARPPALVCGVSLVLPVVGPLIFLAMPTAGGGEADIDAGPAISESTAAAPAAAAHAGALNISKGGGHAPAAAGYQTATYTRKDTEFDRRFFETKFTGFFRVVLGDAEKNVVITIKTLKNEYIVKRVARITGNEIHIQVQQASAGDIGIPFGEIVQVTVKAK
jgi:hypothetical protein